MKNSLKTKSSLRLTLRADTAEDLMTPNPVSIRADAAILEAIALLVDKGFSAAPVIDEAGRPVGVLSKSDILVHDRELVHYLVPREYSAASDLRLDSGEALKEGFQIENVDSTPVRDLMTPMVFAVAPDTPASKVVTEMVAQKVHRLFVVDGSGVLVGVISALDVLRVLGS